MGEKYRLFLLFSSLTLIFFTSVNQVKAQSDPGVVSGNNTIIRGDLYDQRFDISKPLSAVIELTQGTKLGEVTQKWAARFWPTNNIHDVSDMWRYGSQYEGADPALKFKALQDVTTPFTTQQRISQTSILCSRNPLTGAVDVTYTSEERTYTEKLPWIRQLDQFMNTDNSFYNFKAPRTDQNYDKPEELIDLPQVECDPQDTGVVNPILTKDTYFYNQYGGGDTVESAPVDPTPFGSFFDKVIKGVLTTFFEYTIPFEAWINPRRRVPYNESFSFAAGHLTADDVPKSPLSQTQLNIMDGRDGFSSTYKPFALTIKPPNVNSKINNSFTTGEFTKPIDTEHQALNATKKFMDFMDCSRLPKALVDRLPADKLDYCKTEINQLTQEQAKLDQKKQADAATEVTSE